MNDIIINKYTTCAVTGHRTLPRNFDKEKLKKVFIKLIKDGFNTFLIGMAVGFDTVCFQTLEKLREEYPIKIIACIPCRNQSCRFSENQKIEYNRMVSVADEKIVLSEEYTPSCMQKRNEFMVDNCAFLVSFLIRNYGGSYNTVRYAAKKQVPTVNIIDKLYGI